MKVLLKGLHQAYKLDIVTGVSSFCDNIIDKVHTLSNDNQLQESDLDLILNKIDELIGKEVN